jgi:hypothetical protein
MKKCTIPWLVGSIRAAEIGSNGSRGPQVLDCISNRDPNGKSSLYSLDDSFYLFNPLNKI